MWVLEGCGGRVVEGHQNVPHFLTSGRYTIGRPAKGATVETVDIVVRNDPSVSKLHPEVCVDAVEDGGEMALRLRDLSKFGTKLDGKRLGKDFIEVKDGSLIEFGKMSTFRVRWQPLRFCVGGQVRDLDILKEKATSLGIVVLPGWDPACTHVLLANGQAISPIGACGLLAQKPFVTPEWVESMTTSRLSKGGLIQDPDHIPTRATVQGADGTRGIVLESLRDGRKCLLQGKCFIWPEEQYREASQEMVHLAGGDSLGMRDLAGHTGVDLIAVKRGRQSLEGHGFRTGDLRGCQWTNESRLLEAVIFCDASILFPENGTAGDDDSDTTEGEPEEMHNADTAEDEQCEVTSKQGGNNALQQQSLKQSLASNLVAVGSATQGRKRPRRSCRGEDGAAGRRGMRIESARVGQHVTILNTACGQPKTRKAYGRRSSANVGRTRKVCASDDGFSVESDDRDVGVDAGKRGNGDKDDSGDEGDITSTIVLEDLVIGTDGLSSVGEQGAVGEASSGIPNYKAFKKRGDIGKEPVLIPYSEYVYKEAAIDGELFLREVRERHMRQQAADELFLDMRTGQGRPRGRGRGRGSSRARARRG